MLRKGHTTVAPHATQSQTRRLGKPFFFTPTQIKSASSTSEAEHLEVEILRVFLTMSDGTPTEMTVVFRFRMPSVTVVPA